MQKVYFKEGSKVTCPVLGHGVVIETTGDKEYSVKVMFDNNILELFTHDGKFFSYGKRILFQGHIEIPEPVLKEIVGFERNEKVWVKLQWSDLWDVRYYCCLSDGEHFVYTSQLKGKEDESVHIIPVTDIRKWDDCPL